MTTMERINPGIFKANDIRGEYPSEINEKIISEIVKKLSDFFNSGKIVIAHDARLSSPSLYKAAVRKFQAPGSKFQVIKAGLTTTPMFYFLVKKSKAIGGIMITASHNPSNYNGLKIVDKNVLPISGLEIKKLFNL